MAAGWPGRVVVGVSGSPGSVAALRIAVEIARRAQAPLIAVFAWAASDASSAEGPRSVPPTEIWQRSACDVLMNAFDQACGGIPPDVAVELAPVLGPPAAMLVGHASRPDDLIIVGAGHGWRRFRWLRGSVANACIAGAIGPVLAVPATHEVSNIVNDSAASPTRTQPAA